MYVPSIPLLSCNDGFSLVDFAWEEMVVPDQVVVWFHYLIILTLVCRDNYMP